MNDGADNFDDETVYAFDVSVGNGALLPPGRESDFSLRLLSVVFLTS